MIGFLATALIGRGMPSALAKPVVFAGLALLILSAIYGLKCTYDRSVINAHETKRELKQVKRERKADANLQVTQDRDQAASQQRQQEIANATRNIPDQAPSARQRARVCVELRRQAAKRGTSEPAC